MSNEKFNRMNVERGSSQVVSSVPLNCRKDNACDAMVDG